MLNLCSLPHSQEVSVSVDHMQGTAGNGNDRNADNPPAPMIRTGAEVEDIVGVFRILERRVERRVKRRVQFRYVSPKVWFE